MGLLDRFKKKKEGKSKKDLEAPPAPGASPDALSAPGMPAAPGMPSSMESPTLPEFSMPAPPGAEPSPKKEGGIPPPPGMGTAAPAPKESPAFDKPMKISLPKEQSTKPAAPAGMPSFDAPPAAKPMEMPPVAQKPAPGMPPSAPPVQKKPAQPAMQPAATKPAPAFFGAGAPATATRPALKMPTFMGPQTPGAKPAPQAAQKPAFGPTMFGPMDEPPKKVPAFAQKKPSPKKKKSLFPTDLAKDLFGIPKKHKKEHPELYKKVDEEALFEQAQHALAEAHGEEHHPKVSVGKPKQFITVASLYDIAEQLAHLDEDLTLAKDTSFRLADLNEQELEKMASWVQLKQSIEMRAKEIDKVLFKA